MKIKFYFREGFNHVASIKILKLAEALQLCFFIQPKVRSYSITQRWVEPNFNFKRRSFLTNLKAFFYLPFAKFKIRHYDFNGG